MKRITFSAGEDLIEQARIVARSQGKTLNTAFREWLEQFTAQTGSAEPFVSLMERLSHVRSGGRVNRDEMNQRSTAARRPGGRGPSRGQPLRAEP